MTPPHTLTDPYNRRLSYLRLSVTDLCNYRCTYCLPDGYQGKAKPNELNLPEIETLVGVFAAAGTRKIRLTGGEPTLRRDLADIIAVCKANPLIERLPPGQTLPRLPRRRAGQNQHQHRQLRPGRILRNHRQTRMHQHPARAR